MNRSTPSAELAIIGGTGVYDPNLFQNTREAKLSTPYGPTSPSLFVGKFNDRSVAFLPRHGTDHSIPPHRINYRANIFALKDLGIKRIIGVSSVGSLKEELKPGEFVFPDQFIDRTKNRPDTFYDGALVAHVSSADPFCPQINGILANVSRKESLSHHSVGTYVCIEGPRFSTRSESKLFRQWGADIVGMTLYPECILAREAEICYSSICMVTDYDVWAEKPVSAQEVSAVMGKNVANAKKLILRTLAALPEERTCNCGAALSGAII
ncbi:MAG: S-methyl-5'-thioadenosine phosphorylase [Thaumarchaeota archaeon]|nr:S-methyl-5'-thioadenosine phosphorylase [Nitrososphaerota archaeon]